jgi:hypothetical protein
MLLMSCGDVGFLGSSLPSAGCLRNLAFLFLDQTMASTRPDTIEQKGQAHRIQGRRSDFNIKGLFYFFWTLAPNGKSGAIRTMTALSFSLLPGSLLRLHEALVCLAKFSDTVSIEAEPEFVRIPHCFHLQHEVLEHL